MSEQPKIGTPEYNVAAVLMAAMGCKVESDYSECPSCDGSIPCGHTLIWFCTEHDGHEDENREGLCGYAAMLTAALLDSDALAGVLAAAKVEALQEVAREINKGPDYFDRRSRFAD